MSYNGSQDQRWGHISYAQHGDDFFLINVFELIGIDRPSYLDVGAHHPNTISNTALLYDRGSRGVNVEPNPHLFQEFNRRRPEDINLNFGIATFQGELDFLMYNRTHGRNTFSQEEALATYRENSINEIKEVLRLRVKTINQVVDCWCNGRFPDLLNMDIEGLDYEVLESADFSKSQPQVVCVEVRRNETARFKSVMETKGYFCLARLCENLIFVRNCYEGVVR